MQTRWVLPLDCVRLLLLKDLLLYYCCLSRVILLQLRCQAAPGKAVRSTFRA